MFRRRWDLSLIGGCFSLFLWRYRTTSTAMSCLNKHIKEIIISIRGSKDPGKVVQECVSSLLEQLRKPYPPRSRRRAFCLCRRFALLSSTLRDWLVSAVEVSILSRPKYSACSYLHAEGIEWGVGYRVERLLKAFESTTRQKYVITWFLLDSVYKNSMDKYVRGDTNKCPA